MNFYPEPPLKLFPGLFVTETHAGIIIWLLFEILSGSTRGHIPRTQVRGPLSDAEHF